MSQPKKILIVEDEDDLRELIKERLVDEGFKVLEAKNGQEGLDIALKEYPHLILLDIVMPIMDGMTMLHKLREDEWGKYVRVILLTNLSGMEKVSEAIKERAYDYLVKSNWKLDDLIKMVKDRLPES